MAHKVIISHIKKESDGKWAIQSNDEHCEGVAMLAEKFADTFNMGAWGRMLGLLHDRGKERTAFQQHIKRESGYSPEQIVSSDYQHAYIGAVVAKDSTKYAPLLAPQIAGHHRGLYDYTELGTCLQQAIPSEVNEDLPDITLSVDAIMGIKPKEIHHLTRMLFSCLVDADYLDTERFMSPNNFALRGCKKRITELYPLLQAFLDKLNANAINSDVNRIRREVQDNCMAKSKNEKGFYSLTVPTGGGKTLSSMLWAMQHAIHHRLERIIIAIPYTSIIVQTAAVLKRIFGEENVLEHHSNTDPEKTKDENLRHKMQLSVENWDYPIIVTTNVQLFESMYSNKPSTCRRLHNICNSVIILDEVQTLPTDFLQPIVDSLQTYSKIFGVSVLFTTASQPVLSGLIEGCNPRARFMGIDNIQEIIPDGSCLHDKLRRVELNIDNAGKTYDEIASQLIQHDRVLCIVNTRRDAREIYNRLPQDGITLHISRMMCPDHVRSTIEHVKHALADNSNTVIRVIATQLIEAGVDIDFPVVYRQESGLDSVLQAAGRCNREGRMDKGTTHVFSLNAEHPLPRGSMSDANNARLAMGNGHDWFSPQAMTEYFRQLYCRKETFDKKDIAHFLYNPNALCLETAAREFRLIEDNGFSLIVNYGDSPQLVEKLKADGPSYVLMKKLSMLSVTVHKQDMKKLTEAGLVEEVIEGVYYVPDRAQYDDHVGLCTDSHWMEEILIV